MCASEDEGRNARTRIHDSSFRTIGFFNQQREENPGTLTGTVVPWVPVQFSRYDDTSSTGKNSEVKYQNLTTAEQQGAKIMSMDSEPYWEGNCHDTCDWKALLHVRFLQRDLAKALRLCNNNWNTPCPISQKSLQELKWWLKEAPLKNGHPI
jgi:hypothetical protein